MIKLNKIQISLIKFLWSFGNYELLLSSALGSFTTSPKILEAIANDRVIGCMQILSISVTPVPISLLLSMYHWVYGKFYLNFFYLLLLM